MIQLSSITPEAKVNALKNYVSESNGQTYVQQYMASRLATWARDSAVRRSIYIGTAPRGGAPRRGAACVACSCRYPDELFNFSASSVDGQF